MANHYLSWGATWGPAYPTREDKVRRFVQVMGEDRGASRASYFRLRRRLEEEGRLLVQVVPPIPLRHTRPPATPSALELDSMGAPPPGQPEPEPRPVDVPAREEFAQPIRGQAPPRAAPARPILDDTVPWEPPETPARPDEDEDE
jgi:hypothetical protein